MKKIVAIIIATIMVLSCGMTAFAEIQVDGIPTLPPTGEVTHDGNAQYVSADESGDDLTVTGNVTGNGFNRSVEVAGGAKVRVDGTVTADTIWGNSAIAVFDNPTKVTVIGAVTENAKGHAIEAHFGANVEVGSVDEKDNGDAINAADAGTTVMINGTVTEIGEGHAIYVNDSGITVKDDVNENDNGNAIYALNGATVIVCGSVAEKGEGLAINAQNSTVIVGGDVTEEGGSFAITSENNSTVIVEGKVVGDIQGLAPIYLGQLEGTSAGVVQYIHYLIGTKQGGDVQLTDIVFGGDVGDDTVTGVNKGSSPKSYRYTNTADTSTDLTITLKSNVEGKQLKNDIGTLPAGVAKSYDNGVWTLTLGDGFKGGLQELQLLLEDIAHDNPDVPIDVVVSHSSGSSKPLYTGTWANPVTNGNWHYDVATDKWSYSTNYKFTDTWGCIANPYADNEKGWFYFDKNGNMLTGWHWLNWNGVKRCYYLNPSKDTRRGKCQLGGVTPDGYTVDETGAWTVNGVVQEQK